MTTPSTLFGTTHDPAAVTAAIIDAIADSTTQNRPARVVVVAGPDDDRSTMLAALDRGAYGGGALACALRAALLASNEHEHHTAHTARNRQARFLGQAQVHLLDPTAHTWDWVGGGMSPAPADHAAGLRDAEIIVDLSWDGPTAQAGHPWDGGIASAPAHPVKRHAFTQHGPAPADHAAGLRTWLSDYTRRGTSQAAIEILRDTLAGIDQQLATLPVPPAANDHCPTDQESAADDLRAQRSALTGALDRLARDGE